MFFAALFAIARTSRQSRCPSTDEWIKKLWYNNAVQYNGILFSHKMENIVSVLMRLMDLDLLYRMK